MSFNSSMYLIWYCKSFQFNSLHCQSCAVFYQPILTSSLRPWGAVSGFWHRFCESGRSGLQATLMPTDENTQLRFKPGFAARSQFPLARPQHSRQVSHYMCMCITTFPSTPHKNKTERKHQEGYIFQSLFSSVKFQMTHDLSSVWSRQR